MRLDARDNHQPNRFHKTLADSERVEAKVFALLSQLFCGMKSEDFRSSPQVVETAKSQQQITGSSRLRADDLVEQRRELDGRADHHVVAGGDLQHFDPFFTCPLARWHCSSVLWRG